MTRHPNSIEAQARAQAFLPELRREVCALYRAAADGLTSDQVERLTGRKHQTISALTTMLKQEGVLFESGRTRLTRSGRRAAVLVIDPAKVEPEPRQLVLDSP